MRENGAVAPDKSELVVAGLFNWLSARLPGTVATYLSMDDEVDISPLMDRLPGWRWVLPRVEPQSQLTFRDRGVPLERHPLGMLQPVDSGPMVPVAQIDVILTPGIAFDRTGGRLGRGLGFYDTVLAACRTDCEVVGVAVEERVVDIVPMEEHDQPVGWLATENGVTRCRTIR